MAQMPISLWLKWKAWFIFQGPVGGLREDYHAMVNALETAKPYIPEKDRIAANFVQPWRRLSDYKPWVDFGLDGDRGPAEFVID